MEALLNFVQRINALRIELAEKMFSHVDSALLERINSESVVELMEISTHQFIEQIEPNEILVKQIDATSLTMEVLGTIHVELIYGSGSDRRNDNGAVINDSFPVRSEVTVYFKKPLGKYMELDTFVVDISSWYE